LMSFVVKKPNSTPLMAEEVGWWVFMTAPICLLRFLPGENRAQRRSVKVRSRRETCGEFFRDQKSSARV
jgi:hypothetical protein